MSRLHTRSRMAYSLHNMTSLPSYQPPAPDDELPVEEVAQRLGLPLGLLIRRVEAGDVPARREDGPGGVRYHLRLADLGIEPSDVMGDDEAVEWDAAIATTTTATVDETVDEKVGDADIEDVVGESDDEDDLDDAGEQELVGSAVEKSHPIETPDDTETNLFDTAADDIDGVLPDEILAESSQEASPLEQALFDYPMPSPRGEVAAMSLDPRELVAGLLDRWERTLEQRIYIEQRQRFEGVLNARENLIKQLQMELQVARAEHAAAQADKERELAERERHLATLEREAADHRAETKKRGWFRR